MRAAQFPPQFDVNRLLRPLRHSGWVTSSYYRRQVTRESPLCFALTYLGEYLQQPDTRQISFNRMHLEMCSAARRWMEPGAFRDAWVAPRQGGKTLWLWHALPLWALAHGHRKFMLAFANTERQANSHLKNILNDLRSNELLLYDFPDLRLLRGQGGADQYGLQSGATIAVRGMQSTVLGARSGKYRPDLMVGDDLEKDEARNTQKEVEDNRARLLQAIIPMNARGGAVQITGTVTMYGSLIHEIVAAAKGRRGGEWVRANRFEPHYYSPIEPDGSSLWPQQWSVEWLRAEQAADPHGYSLNYENDPQPPKDMTYWTEGGFQYDERFPIVDRVLHLDVATTTGPDSDYTVLVLLGRDAARRKALVERVEWGRWTTPQIRDRIHAFCEPLRVKPLVRVESNQGGNTWLDSLAPWPVDVRFETTRAKAPKDVRIRRAHSRYHARAVWHPWKMQDLEDELCRYPRGKHDDVPDAIAGALEWAFPVTG